MTRIRWTASGRRKPPDSIASEGGLNYREAYASRSSDRFTGQPLPSVELHIEELVLHGFAPGDRHQIAEGTLRELSRLLEQARPPASSSRGAEIESLDAGSFQLGTGGQAEATGCQIARSVFVATVAVMTRVTAPAAGPAPPGDACQ
jgi:hypothetical protein